MPRYMKTVSMPLPEDMTINVAKVRARIKERIRFVGLGRKTVHNTDKRHKSRAAQKREWN